MPIILVRLALLICLRRCWTAARQDALAGLPVQGFHPVRIRPPGRERTASAAGRADALQEAPVGLSGYACLRHPPDALDRPRVVDLGFVALSNIYFVLGLVEAVVALFCLRKDVGNRAIYNYLNIIILKKSGFQTPVATSNTTEITR